MSKYLGMLDVDPHSLGIAKAGEKVRFTGRGGMASQLEVAKVLFHPHQELTVERTDIGGWSSTYRFEGFNGWYNTVMFEPVDLLKPSAAKSDVIPDIAGVPAWEFLRGMAREMSKAHPKDLEEKQGILDIFTLADWLERHHGLSRRLESQRS